MPAVEKRPPHIDADIWERVIAMSLPQQVGQLISHDAATARERTGRSIEELVAAGSAGMVRNIAMPTSPGDSAEGVMAPLQRIAAENGHPPLLCAGNYQRGVNVVGPSGFGAPNSWNPGLVEKAAARAARHMRIVGVTCTFSPVADFATANPQGRSQEGAAVESPKLMADMIAAMVAGHQAEDAVAACVKHIGPYQYTRGPDYTAEPISRRAFLEDCWPRYAAGLEAGTLAVMMSFVDLDGEPSHASDYLSGLVRRQGVPGIVIVSDFTGINELVEFGIAGSLREATFLAFTRGGVHVDLSGGVYADWLGGLVEDGSISRHDLMARTADILQLKKKLGLFEDPRSCGIPARRGELFEVPTEFVKLAEESIVLLRPADGAASVLPIPEDARVLVCGPLADSKVDWLGEWCANSRGHLDRVVTPFAGLRSVWAETVLAPGVGIEDELADAERLRALAAAKAASHIVVCLGEPENWSGESKARIAPRLPPVQTEFVRQLRAASPQAKIIALLTTGRQIKIPDAVQSSADAILWVPQLGSFAGTALANILSGKVNPSGRLAYSLPCDERLTGGFSHRERRLGRPLFLANPISRSYRAPQWSAHFQELGTDRPYAEFWFGEGYSCTTFKLSNRFLSGISLSLRGGAPLVASVTVVNAGTRAGRETVQLYWHDTVSEAVPRRLELLGHSQVELQAGERRVVSFDITPAMLAQYGRDIEDGLRPRADPHPNYLFLVRHAGEAEAALIDFDRRDELLTFTLVD